MHEQLVSAVRERIESTYARALDRQVEEPVVFVLDLDDDEAAWVTETLADARSIEAALSESAVQKIRPLLTIAVSRKRATLLVGELSEKLTQGLDMGPPPEARFQAITVTNGSMCGHALSKP
ncbi:MAG: hypothetical protein ACT4QC_21825 [Planctomycetaceae bacterium]